MYFTWKREKCKKKKEERTTGPPLTREEEHVAARQVTRWKVIFGQTSSKEHERHQHTGNEKHMPTIFSNLMLKINVN
jgi:hypothetical protein